MQNEKRQNRKRVVADRVAGSDAPARGQGADQDEEPGDVATGMPQAKKARRGTVSDAPRQGGDEGDADDTEVGEEERDEDDDEEDDDEEQDDDEESSEAGEDTGDQARDAGGGVSDRARSEDEALDNGDDSD